MKKMTMMEKTTREKTISVNLPKCLGRVVGRVVSGTDVYGNL